MPIFVYVVNITVDAARLKLPASSGTCLTVNILFHVHSEEEIELRKVGSRSGQVNRTHCANWLPYINVQARRTHFDLAKIASHVLEIMRRVKILQDIKVLCTNSGCFENIKAQNVIFGWNTKVGWSLSEDYCSYRL